MRSQTLASIREKILIETTSEDFIALLRRGDVSTNHYLRRLHNLAFGLGWLPGPILAPKLWPAIHPIRKRAITWNEHSRIVAAEKNPERRLYYELLWEIGASQTDAANLRGEDIDRSSRTISYRRRKTGQLACLMVGPRLGALLEHLPAKGSLFPSVGQKKDTDRSAEFRRRCGLLGIEGITLHSYRYAWAQRAKTNGYPERWEQSALGHNSRAVHEAYARDATVVCPSLEEYENKIASFRQAVGQ